MPSSSATAAQNHAPSAAGAVVMALALFCLAAGTLAPSSAAAQNPQYLETHRDWHTFQMEENGTPVCFMATRPTDSRGNYTRRGEIALFVTHRPGQGSRDVVSLHTGYSYQTGAGATARIRGQSFTFFTSGEIAFAHAEDDRTLIDAMMDGADIVIEGTSTRGTLTTDTFSLRGFTAAYDQITAACGY